MSDSSAAHNSQVPLTKLAPHLAKKPQQGGFKSQVCPAFISISFSGSLWDGRLECRALLEIRADSHLAKTQLKVAPVEEQHGQLLQELAHGTPCPIARGAPHPGDMQDQHKGIHKTLPPQRRVIHSHTEQTMGKLGLQKGITATEPQSVGPGMSQTPEESREEAGVGVRTAAPGSVYWRSRCCRSPARTHRQVREQTIWLCLVMLILMFPLRSQCLLSCREHDNKNPKFGHGRKGLAPATGLHDRSLAAGTCCQPGGDRSHPACPRLPATAPRPGTHHSLLLLLELEADVLGPEEAKGADL